MNRQTEEGAYLERRAFLRNAATALVVILAASSWSADGARADDGEDHDSGDSSDDSSDDSDDDSGGDDGSDDSGDGDDEGGASGGNSGSGSGSSGSDSGGGGGDDRFGRGALDQSDAKRAVLLGQAIPLKDALRRVEGAYGGSVIDVDLRSTGRRLEYSFKVRTERGSVRTIRMDAESGRFLGLGALFR
ncbi:MAG: PepSY domain-containing protein [Oricola sp.]